MEAISCACLTPKSTDWSPSTPKSVKIWLRQKHIDLKTHACVSLIYRKIHVLINHIEKIVYMTLTINLWRGLKFNMSTTALFENYMKWLASFSLKNAEGGKIALITWSRKYASIWWGLVTSVILLNFHLIISKGFGAFHENVGLEWNVLLEYSTNSCRWHVYESDRKKINVYNVPHHKIEQQHGSASQKCPIHKRRHNIFLHSWVSSRWSHWCSCLWENICYPANQTLTCIVFDAKFFQKHW